MKQIKDEQRLNDLLKRDLTISYQRELTGLDKEDDLNMYLQTRLDKF